MSTKKVILIIGILFIIAIAAFLIFSSKNVSSPTEDSGFSLRSFFPFRNPDETTNDSGSNNNNTSDEEVVTPNSSTVSIPKLRKLSSGPVAGAISFGKGATTTIRFVMKDTGNVYEAKSDSLQITRLTNTTIPKINRVVWLPAGDGFLTQKADESGIILTSHVRLKSVGVSSSSELALPYEPVISSLPMGILEISPSPDGKKIFYYTSEGGMRAFISDPDGSKSSVVFTGPISEWISTWFSQNGILLTTKASYGSQSQGYTLNPVNKTISKTFGNVLGGSVVPDSLGKNILASQGGDSPSLFMITVANETRTPLSARTLSEKCAWKPSADPMVVCGVPKLIPRSNYPDTWYQGLINTDDTIQLIDISNNIFLPISDPSEEVGEHIDVQSMSVSQNSKYALFVNKLDQSLWLLELTK